MTPQLVEVVVGRIRIRVPVIVDAATTQRVVATVNARLEQIEKNSDRVDSHLFALQAAVSFAGELELLKGVVEEEREQSERETSHETRELLKELNRLSAVLRGETQE